ncbi:MAG TPA: histidine kinase [Ohtaekwangia sp.]|nr:histidine kinase [Ohtaekwangia sp.]
MKTIFSTRKVLWLHVSFWCVYISFNLYQLSTFQRRVDSFDWGHALGMMVFHLVCTLLIAYLNYFYFLPRFLHRRKLLLYLIEFGIPFAGIVYLRVYVQRHFVHEPEFLERYFNSPWFVFQLSAITLFIVIFIGLLRFVGDWFEFEAAKKEVENEKLTAELNFLKAQINPHFLFNTLNNLYYLAYTKSDNTTEVISKLSHVMRYMIYDASHSQVLLSKEVEYMEDYISLERLRLNNKIPITFTVKGDTVSVSVAPLILITFLENAFKHGIPTNSAEAWINISIEVRDEICIYRVENSKLKGPNQHEKSGIGLINVKRRLELSYPGRYTLDIQDMTDRYSIELNLSLK